MAKQTFSAVNSYGKVVKVSVEITGTTLDEVTDSVRRLGKVPKSVSHTPVKYAIRRVLTMSKGLAPVREGALKDSLIMKEEKFVRRGKTVFDVRPMSEKEWNASEDVRVAKGGKRRFYTATRERRGFADKEHSYYYPASMEYGFRTVDGGHVEGRHYLLGAMEAVDTEQIILDRAGKALDRIWARKQSET